MTLQPLIPCHIIDYPPSDVRPCHTSVAMYAIMVVRYITFLPPTHPVASNSHKHLALQHHATDRRSRLNRYLELRRRIWVPHSCLGGGSRTFLPLPLCSTYEYKAGHECPLSSASQWLRSQGARDAHSRWPSAAQDSLLECHRAIVRSSNQPGLTSSASLTHLHAPLGGLEQPTSAYGGRSHSCSPPIPHAPRNLLESLRSCFISSIGLAGSWQGSDVFSNGTESEYSTASIRRGAYGPPLLSLDPRAPGAECHGASPSPYPCGLLLPCLLGPLRRQGSYMSWPSLKGMASKLWPPRNISRS